MPCKLVLKYRNNDVHIACILAGATAEAIFEVNFLTYCANHTIDVQYQRSESDGEVSITGGSD